MDNLIAACFCDIDFEDLGRARRALQSIIGNGISDDDLLQIAPVLSEALLTSPDPDRSINCLSSWFQALPSPRPYLQTLIHSQHALKLFCHVTGCSQYFADLIVKNPEYFSIIEEPGPSGSTRSTANFYKQISALLEVCHQPELKREALRRWKAKEMMRIGVRDLAGLADMPTTAREFSNLADACIQAALDITYSSLRLEAPHQAPSFAVIGMGKLGGQELNYSSDIDLMFVHSNDLPPHVRLTDGRTLDAVVYITRIAEQLIKNLNDETSEGHVFRVDMRLRPEGRFGPLTRSLKAFEAYYESWAEGWEFQALIKARFIAGDRPLGSAFMDLIEPAVFRKNVPVTVLEEIRTNKRMIEEKCELEGETETNVKTGFGGIRDVEFIVQALQIEHGGRNPQIRSRNTLTALQRLHRAHLLSEPDTHLLAYGYIFLRNLEHRLQLLNSFQVQNLPPASNQKERQKVALRMGYSDLDTFEIDLRRHRTQIHLALHRLFHYHNDSQELGVPDKSGAWAQLGTLLDNLSSAPALDKLNALLTAHGFRNLPAAIQALQLPMKGNDFGEMPPDTPVEFKRIAPQLMARAARSSNPDAALAGIETMALAVPNRAQLYAAFEDSPDVMDKLIRLGAGSPPLVRLLAGHQEWLETLLSPELDDVETSLAGASLAMHNQRYKVRIVDEMCRRRKRHAAPDKQIDAVSAVFQREALLIAAREIWEDTDSARAMRDLTELADATLQVMLDYSIEQLAVQTGRPTEAESLLRRVAIVGLGKLGGAELGYASDWDLLFTFTLNRTVRQAFSESEASVLVERLVSTVAEAGQNLITRGANIEIDLRLRPWGKKGALALPVSGYIEYYRSAGETWERQAALKGRFVAGHDFSGKRLLRALGAISFGGGLTPEEDSDIVSMKKRIETERLKPEDAHTDVKLGFGGLIDIEWLVQKLQLKFGKRYPGIRCSNTILALAALAGANLLNNYEADALIASYNLLVRVRNGLWLQNGRSQDTLPPSGQLRETLALQLGYRSFEDEVQSASDRFYDDIQRHMTEVRAIFNRRFHDFTG